MILICHVSYFWCHNFLVDPESLKVKSFITPFIFQSFLGEIPKEVVALQALSQIESSISIEKTYIVSSTPKVKADASFLEVLAKFQEIPPFLWLEDLTACSKTKCFPIPEDYSAFFSGFFLEPNPQNSQNILKNRSIYGPKIPKDEYEASLESSAIFLKLEYGIKNLFDEVLKDTPNAIISGSCPLFFNHPHQVLAKVLNAIPTSGTWEISLDEHGVFSALAILNYFEKEVFTKIMQTNPFLNSASILVLERAKSVSVEFKDGTMQDLNLKESGVFSLPIKEYDTVTIRVRAKKDLSFVVSGAKYGVIVDTRARPVMDSSSKQQLQKNFLEVSKIVKTSL